MKTIGRFRRETKGNVGVLFALAAIPVLMATGVAVDFAQGSQIKARIQSALDAGALAAAASKTLSDGQRKALALQTFQHNLADGGLQGVKVTPEFAIEDGGVRMSASAEVPTAFMRLAGVNTMDLGASVEVSLPQGRKAEIALVLDYSASMNETAGGKVKYVAMRDAATKLVEDLTEKGKNNDVKFGLVPFSHHVYATLPGEYVVGQKAGTSWTGCTQDRKYPYNTTDATPDSKDDDTRWGHAQAPDHAKYGCAAYAPNRLVVKPISTDQAGVIDQISRMRPYQYTHISLGFEFGWHLLSPNAPFGNVAAYGDEKTLKVLVLLTDGRQTEPSFGPNGRRDVGQGERNLTRLCDNAKAKGVRVITLAFDLREKDTRERLRDCASDPDVDFFVADDNQDLAQAFETIRNQLAANIYISK